MPPGGGTRFPSCWSFVWTVQLGRILPLWAQVNQFLPFCFQSLPSGGRNTVSWIRALLAYTYLDRALWSDNFEMYLFSNYKCILPASFSGAHHVWSSRSEICHSGHCVKVWHGLVQWGRSKYWHDFQQLPGQAEEHSSGWGWRGSPAQAEGQRRRGRRGSLSHAAGIIGMHNIPPPPSK